MLDHAFQQLADHLTRPPPEPELVREGARAVPSSVTSLTAEEAAAMAEASTRAVEESSADWIRKAEAKTAEAYARFRRGGFSPGALANFPAMLDRIDAHIERQRQDYAEGDRRLAAQRLRIAARTPEVLPVFDAQVTRAQAATARRGLALQEQALALRALYAMAVPEGARGEVFTDPAALLASLGAARS